MMSKMGGGIPNIPGLGGLGKMFGK